jgi:hypothetical protein
MARRCGLGHVYSVGLFVALVLLPRDVVQGKLENLGQVLSLSYRHLSFVFFSLVKTMIVLL